MTIHLPIPNGNEPGEMQRTFRTWAAALTKAISEAAASGPTPASGLTQGSNTPAGTPVSEDLTDYLLPPEKVFYKNRWDVVVAEEPTIVSQALQAGVSSVAYVAAYTALGNYLTDVPASLYTYGGKTWPVVNWNVLDTIKKYLGPGGKKNWMAQWALYDAALNAIKAAILQGALDPGDAPDMVRPLIFWDFAGANMPTQPSSGTPTPALWAPTTVALTNASGPVSVDDATASQFTDTSGAGTSIRLTFPTQNVRYVQPTYDVNEASLYATGVPPVEAYVVQMRVKWDGAGTWKGQVGYTGGSYLKTVAAPISGQWIIKTWDMKNLDTTPTGGTQFMSLAKLTSFYTDLVDGGKCDVDWALIGKFGVGTRSEYDSFISNLATLAMLKAAFLDPATGKISATTHILPGSITSPLIAAYQIFAAQMVVGNFDCLVPNFNSEMVPVDAAGTVAAAWPDVTATAQLESRLVYGTFSGAAASGYNSSKNCRKITTAQGTVDLTGEIQVIAGDVYSINALCTPTGGTVNLILKGKDNATGAWSDLQTISFTAGTWAAHATGIVYTIPNTITHAKLSISGGGTGGFIDNLYWRKAADGRLLVDGTIMARHILTGAIEAYHMRVGPLYQFSTKVIASGGTYLESVNDGGWKRPATGEGGFASADTTFYGDPSRTHPSALPRLRFGAIFWGSNTDRSIMVGLSSAYPGSAGGFELRRVPASAVFKLYTVAALNSYTLVSAGKYDNGTTPGTAGTFTLAAPAGTGTDYERMELRVFNGVNLTASVRLEAWFNGVRKAYWTHGDLGYTNGVDSPIGGFAGLRLASTSQRVGSFSFGNGNVVMEGGTVTADMFDADLAILGVIHSPNYVPGTSSVAATGFKQAGAAFPVQTLDGLTVNAQAEFGADVVIAGYQALTMANLVFGGSQERTTAGYFDWLCPAGITRAKLTLGGAGAGAGGASSTAGGGGGGAGAVFEKWIPVVPGTTYRITVGAAGVGGVSGGNGTAGSPSTMAYLSGPDSGFVTITSNGGALGVGGNSTSNGGNGGATATISAPAGGAGSNATPNAGAGTISTPTVFYPSTWEFPGGGGGGGNTKTSPTNNTFYSGGTGGACTGYFPTGLAGVAGFTTTGSPVNSRGGGGGGSSMKGRGGRGGGESYLDPGNFVTPQAGNMCAGGGGGGVRDISGTPQAQDGMAGGVGYAKIAWGGAVN